MEKKTKTKTNTRKDQWHDVRFVWLHMICKCHMGSPTCTSIFFFTSIYLWTLLLHLLPPPLSKASPHKNVISSLLYPTISIEWIMGHHVGHSIGRQSLHTSWIEMKTTQPMEFSFVSRRGHGSPVDYRWRCLPLCALTCKWKLMSDILIGSLILYN